MRTRRKDKEREKVARIFLELARRLFDGYSGGFLLYSRDWLVRRRRFSQLTDTVRWNDCNLEGSLSDPVRPS